MLPPQLRQGLIVAQRQGLTTLALKASTTSLLRAGLTHAQSRSFWGWRRRSDDWTSHLDPIYHRFCRIRTLKTRAKLLKNLKRRGKFDWDNQAKPFFTPQLIRWASHWNGKCRQGRWYLNDEANKQQKDEEDGKKAEAEDGFELSAREKEWREKMELMRKRIEKDPYEVIFGKRFEPFWSPLVPSWMREEMGLQGWPKPKEREVPKAPGKPEEAVTKTVKNETGKPNEPETLKKEQPVELNAKQEPKSTTPQSSSYSYASSTSWDSWSNKTRRVEWDSVSGQTRKYEYDPISNRMVQVETPKPALAETKGVEAAPEQTKSTTTSAKDGSMKTESKAESMDPKAVRVPVMQSSDLRKSIPIPPPLSYPSHSIPLTKSVNLSITTVRPEKSTAVASSDAAKPSALAKLPKNDIDLLTADDVRAKMGKTKPPTASASTPEEKSQLERAFDSYIPVQEQVVNAPLNVHDIRKAHVQGVKKTQWDQAETVVMLDKELESLQKKKEKLVKDERGLFHIERQRRELMKLDERIKDIISRVDKLAVDPKNLAPPIVETIEAVVKNASVALQPSIDRMQSKDLPKAVIEPDDSAAHESTEAIAALNAVPKNWAQQAELLQADRVRRTASTRPYPVHSPARWADDMQARKEAYEAKQAEEKAVDAEKQAKLEKANKLLEAEVTEQKLRMQAHENRYSHKISGLRAELEVAYKQSAVHSEKHLERIKYLEQELSNAQKAAGASELKPSIVPKELSKKAMKKAEQKANDQALVKEVREIYEKQYGVIDAAHQQPQPEIPKAIPVPEKMGRQVVEVESDVDLGEALAKYENEAQPYGFRKDNLENEVAAKEREYHEAQGPLWKTKIASSITSSLGSAEAERKLVDDKMPKLIPTGMAKSPGEVDEIAKANSISADSLASTLQWEEPPVYKVLAYDPGNDMMSTATTTSNFTSTETPISISQALSQLYQPARFVPYFAELQTQGYQVIFGTKDLLVFKKVKETESLGLENHGLETGGKATSFNPVTSLKDARTSSINPVDGTSTSNHLEPSTGKPTTFQENDPIFLSDKSAATPPPLQLAEEDYEDDIEWKHYPRVRRMEQHFTGSRRKWNSNHRRHQKRSDERAPGGAGAKEKRKSRWRFVLWGGLGTAGVCYMVGTLAERSRRREREEVDWVRKAEEQRKRWREG